MLYPIKHTRGSIKFDRLDLVQKILRGIRAIAPHLSGVIISTGKVIHIRPYPDLKLTFTILQPHKPAGVWCYRPHGSGWQFPFVSAIESVDEDYQGEAIATADGYGYLTSLGFFPVVDLFGKEMIVVPHRLYPVDELDRRSLLGLFRKLRQAVPAVPGSKLVVSGESRWVELEADGVKVLAMPLVRQVEDESILRLLEVDRVQTRNISICDYRSGGSYHSVPLNELLPPDPRFGLIYLDSDNPLLRPSRNGTSLYRRLKQSMVLSESSFHFRLSRSRYGRMEAKYSALDGSLAPVQFYVYAEKGRFYEIPLSEYLRTYSLHWDRVYDRPQAPVYDILERYGGRAVFRPVEISESESTWYATLSGDVVCTAHNYNMHKAFLSMKVALVGIRTTWNGEEAFLVPVEWSHGNHTLLSHVHRYVSDDGGSQV